MSILENIIQARCGASTQRCHGIRHVGSYSNAEHQWGVTALLWYLYPNNFQRLAAYALFHDVSEAWVGDIPAPTLRHVPGLREKITKIEGNIAASIGCPREDSLSPEDHAMLKACDRLDLLLWCKEQLLFGNLFVGPCVDELCKYLDTSDLPGAAREVYVAIMADPCMPRQAGVMEKFGNVG